ncbi:hypothetical protein EDD15DRAFT_2511937, partial [Pisolithus albus]
MGWIARWISMSQRLLKGMRNSTSPPSQALSGLTPLSQPSCHGTPSSIAHHPPLMLQGLHLRTWGISLGHLVLVAMDT